MNNKPMMGFDGLFQFEKRRILERDADGNPVRLSDPEIVVPWQHNLITDAGLDYLGTSTADLLGYCRLGTSNTTPANSDTQLGAQVGYSNTNGASDVTGFSTDSSYAYRRVTRRFGAGVVDGVNLAEVGMGPGSSNSLFSRALLKDTNGDPTTITLDEDEILDVIYELRLYANLTPVTGTYDIDGVSTTVTITPIGWGGNAWAPGNIGYGAVFGVSSSSPGIRQVASPTEDYTSAASSGNFIGTGTWGSYTPGTYSRQQQISFSLSQGNFATGIGGFRYGKSTFASPADISGIGQFAVKFDPKIQKDNTKTGQITVGVSWGRYTG